MQSGDCCLEPEGCHPLLCTQLGRGTSFLLAAGWHLSPLTVCFVFAGLKQREGSRGSTSLKVGAAPGCASGIFLCQNSEFAVRLPVELLVVTGTAGTVPHMLQTSASILQCTVSLWDWGSGLLQAGSMPAQQCSAGRTQIEQCP